MELQSLHTKTKHISRFSQQLVQEMSTYCQDLLDTVPIFQGAKEGLITQKELGWYLFNLKFLLSNTDDCIRKAMFRSQELGLKDLAAFYLEKLDEEEGHEEWAKDDLRSNEINCDQFSEPSPHLIESMAFLRKSIQENPASYLGYVLLTEFVTVFVGSVWLKNLEKFCGIKNSSMSSVANHVELDKHHVMDDFAIIDKTCIEQKNEKAIQAVVHGAMRFFERFVREIEVRKVS